MGRTPDPSGTRKSGLDVKYAGETVTEKLIRLRSEMDEKNASVHILSSLDDIAWLFNIRKNSDDGNVLAPAFALITEDEARLFIASRKFSPELRAYFEKNHVTIENTTRSMMRWRS